MGQVSIYLHKSVQDYAEYISSVLNTSRSEVIEMMVKHVRDEDLEGDIWEDFDKIRDEYEDSVDETLEESGDEESSSDEE